MVRITASLVLAASLLPLISAVPLTERASVISVPVSRSTKVGPNFIARELARVHSFATSANSSATAPVINEDVSYIAKTTVGTQSFDLIVDTGSSNTWVGANTKFEAGSATKTGGTVQVSYGSGSFSGDEYIDSVGLDGTTAPKMSIGVATTSTGFTGVDGIIGFGPRDLTDKTVDNHSPVNTIMDNLHHEGIIPENVLGVSFAPESGSSDDSQNGSLDLGGTDSAKFTGDITYIPKTSTSPYNLYWGIDVDGISVGSKSISSAATAIVDTGTTLIYIPSAAYDAFLSATGGKTDESSGMSSFTTKPTEDVSITVGGKALTLTPDDYLVPTDQYTNFQLTTGSYYSWLFDGGADAADVNFIIGQKFLEHFYAVFDQPNQQVGFATAA